ncbi:hypothetical protein DFQ28_005234 [Apophysomyces sp. BC1034]|nr:hypothetical protein DFQ30_010302 [Apophysomyces sp. BC1015]KAG0170774.1 hypothetical protein DFQ29_009112 [Apophysomyces sp. BC1021]KAG0188198.1 hypothetical protein DFQ28_005234 [Apophysomyces sp. BC1034]
MTKNTSSYENEIATSDTTDDCSNYEDVSDSGSEDEYGQIPMSSWGGQTQSASKDEGMDWKCLIDPSVKMKAGGIGAGQLHRSGANYKPVNEDFILAQRMKTAPKKPSKPMPVVDTSAKKKKKKKKKATTIHQAKVHIPAVRPQRHAPTTTPTQVNNAISFWGSGQLTSTPFWQQTDASSQAKTADAPDAKHPPNPNRRTTPSPIPTKRDVVTPNANHHIQKQETKPNQNQTEQEPAATPSPAESTPTKQYTPSPQSPTTTKTATAKTPLLRFHIELAPGISTELNICQHDYLPEVVEAFGKKHQLTITDTAKKALVETLSLLLIGKLGSKLCQEQKS